jgi:hypothetical protein
MTVDEYATELQARSLELVAEGSYTNSFGQVGYRATYRNADLHLWFSVSATEVRIAPDEVAMAISAQGRWIQRANPYTNSKDNIGFEATVHSGGHAFMLGAAHRRPSIY